MPPGTSGSDHAYHQGLRHDQGVEMASLALQVFGGTGFIEGTGAAQHYRDIRIAPIYEGTNASRPWIWLAESCMRTTVCIDGCCWGICAKPSSTNLGRGNSARLPDRGSGPVRPAQDGRERYESRPNRAPPS